jgi:hypothetical protein
VFSTHKHTHYSSMYLKVAVVNDNGCRVQQNRSQSKGAPARRVGAVQGTHACQGRRKEDCWCTIRRKG